MTSLTVGPIVSPLASAGGLTTVTLGVTMAAASAAVLVLGMTALRAK